MQIQKVKISVQDVVSENDHDEREKPSGESEEVKSKIAENKVALLARLVHARLNGVT